MLPNDGLVVEHLDRLDGLADAVGVAGDGVGMHDLAVDEDDGHGLLGLDDVGDGGGDAHLGRLEHALALDVAVDEHVGAGAGHAQHVLAAAGVAPAAVHPDDVVVVGDAAAKLLPAHVLALPVGDARDGLVGGQPMCHGLFLWSNRAEAVGRRAGGA